MLYYIVTCDYYKPVHGTMTVKIAKASSTITVVNRDSLSKIYDALPVLPEVTVTGSTAEPRISFHPERTDLTAEELAQLPFLDRYSILGYSTAVNAGNWLLKVVLDSDDNYREVVSYVEFTISKFDLTIEFNEERIYNKVNIYEGEYSTMFGDQQLDVEFKFGVVPNVADATYTYAAGNIVMSKEAFHVYLESKEISLVNFNITYDMTVKILKTTPQVTVEAKDKVYDGTPYADPKVLTTSDSLPEFIYFTKAGVELPTAPTNAGEYKVRVFLEENSNSLSFEGMFEFTIETKVLNVESGSSTLEYTGSFVAPSFSVTGDNEGIYRIITTPAEGYDGSSVGNQMVNLSLDDESGNYSLNITSKSYRIINRKLKLAHSERMAVTGENYRKELSDFNELLPEGMYFVGYVTTTAATVGVYNRFGTHLVAEGVDILNAEGQSVLSNFDLTYQFNIVITNPLIEHTVLDGTLVDGVWEVSYDYDALTHKAVVLTDVPGAQVSYRANNATSVTPFNYRSAVDLEITYIITAPNYEMTTGTIHFVIRPIQLSIEFTNPDALHGKKFDGKDIEIEYSISPISAPSKIKFYKNGVQTLSSFEIGVYTVEIIVEDTQNYYGFIETFEYEIERNFMNIEILSSYLKQQYTGDAVLNPIVISSVASTAENTTFTFYSLDDLDTPISNPSEVGKYLVVICVEGNEYYLTTEKEFEFEIAATELYVEWEAEDQYIYNGTVQMPSAFTTDLDGNRIELIVEVEDGAILAGTYTATAKLPEGYPNFGTLNDTYTYTIKPYTFNLSYADVDVLADTEHNYEVVVDEVEDLLENHTILYEFYLPAEKRIRGMIYDSIGDVVVTNLAILMDGEDVTSCFNINYSMYLEVHLPRIEYEFKDATLVNNHYQYEKEYDGEALVPELIVLTDPDNCIVLMEVLEYVEAGVYKLDYEIILEGHETVRDTLTITIKRKNYEIELINELDKIYDGVQIFPELSIFGTQYNTPEFDELGLTVFINYYQDGSYLGYAPVNAGRYQIEVVVCQSANYAETHKTFDFEIEKAESDIKVNNMADAQYDFTKVYDGTALTIAAKQTDSKVFADILYEVIGNGAVSYSFYDADGAVSSIIDSGEYTVQFHVSESDNYKAYDSKHYTIQVLKKHIFFGDLSAEFMKNYDGERFSIDASNFSILKAEIIKEWIGEGEFAFYNVNGVSLVQDPRPGLTVEGMIHTITGNQGTYINNNHFDISDLIVRDEHGQDITKNYIVDVFMNVFIKPAKIEVTCNSYEVDYTGQAYTINPRPVLEEGVSVQYQVLYSADGKNYQLSPIRYSDCGTYTIYYKVVFANFEEVEGSAEVTIHKIDANEIVISEDLSKDYDGFAVKEPLYSSNTDGVAAYHWFKQNASGEYEEVEGAITVGKYKVLIEIAEGTNYLAISKEVEFEISVREITLTWSSNLFFYNGLVQMPKAYVLVSLKDPIDVVVTANDESINRGLYTATATTTNTNYKLVNPTFEYSIDYRVIDVPEEIVREFTGREISLDYNDYYTPSQSTVLNVGTYDVTLVLNDKDNYKWRIVLEDGTITTSTEDAHVTVRVTAAELSSAKVSEIKDQNYTGKAITPTPTISFFGKTLVLGKDYTVTYENNVEASSNAIIRVTGCGNYTGELEITFKIKLTVFTIKEDSNYEFLVAKNATTLVKDPHKVYKSSQRVVVRNVEEQTTIQDFLNNFTLQEGQSVLVYNNRNAKVNANAFATTYIGTGFRILLKDGAATKDIIYVAVNGDLDGDGMVITPDFMQLQNFVSGMGNLSYEYYAAADMDNDGLVTNSDLVEMLNRI